MMKLDGIGAPTVESIAWLQGSYMAKVLDEGFQGRVSLDCLPELAFPQDFRIVALRDEIRFPCLGVSIDLMIRNIAVRVNSVRIGTPRTAVEHTPVELVDGIRSFTKAIDEKTAHLVLAMTVAPVLDVLVNLFRFILQPLDGHFRLESVVRLTRNKANLFFLEQSGSPKDTAKTSDGER